MSTVATSQPVPETFRAESTVVKVLVALSLSHLLNDTIQSLIPALYPLLKASFRLSFTQIGLITIAFQFTASLLQPLVGIYTDRKPRPYSLPTGMAFSLAGLVVLSFAQSYYEVIVGAALVGTGSSIFHPEATRVAKMASGGKHGLAQSIFQVGGNVGTSLGPLLAALVVVPRGQRHVLWFSFLALFGMVLLSRVGRWYRRALIRQGNRPRTQAPAGHAPLSPRRVKAIVGLLMLLIFSKFFYMTSLTSYYIFFLIGKFHLSVQSAQLCLFAFLFSVAVGTIAGGSLGDRFGRRIVIWISIVGVAPFTLILPYVSLGWTIALSLPIGLILASAFPAIVVYAHELMPGRIGTVTGLMIGFAFGVASIGSGVLGVVADHTSIFFVYRICSFLPLIGLFGGFLPNIKSAEAGAH